MSQSLNIYQKLAKIRKPVEVLGKNKKGYGYTYVSEDEILAKISGLMDKYAISLIPNIIPGTIKVDPQHFVNTKTTKDGEIYEAHSNEIFVTAEMEWKWVNDENPEEKIIVPWVLVGQQTDASQAFGSGLTYSTRYFLLKYFNVATPDSDPDAWRSKQKEAKESEDREIAKTIIGQVHNKITSYLASHKQVEEERKKLIEIVTKFERSGNYFEITNPETAAKLLEAVTEATEEVTENSSKTSSTPEDKKTTSKKTAKS